MSEAAAEDRGREIWIEKYRPQALDEIVGHEGITERLKQYIDQQDLPHLLFAGPAGTGKCLTGETPVLTGDGIEPIGNVVGETDGLTEADADLEVATFDKNSGFEFVSPSHVFGTEADDLVRVSTRDGGESTVTPEHRLLTIDDDGLSWRQAVDLEAGDRIARPHGTPLPETDGTIEWVDALDGDRVFVHVTEAFAERHGIPATQNHVGIKQAVFEGIRTGETNDEIDDRIEAKTKTIQHYRREAADIDLNATSTVCSLSYLRSLDESRESLRKHVDAIQYVSPNNNRSRPIEPPWELTPKLAAFAGLALSEARIESTRIKFYNTDRQLIERFSEASRDSFGIEPTAGKQKDVPYRSINNRTLVHYLRRCFAAFDDTDVVGSALVRAPTTARRAFLQTFFDAEGHVQKEGLVELSQKDGDLITLLSYLLSGESIPTRRKTKRKAATNGSGTKRTCHVIYISGSEALSRFEDRIGFTIEAKANRLAINADRTGNQNHDTMPVQSAVDDLCEALYLSKTELLTGSLNRETPGREHYLEDVDRTLDAATERIETVQEVLETISRLESDIERIAALPAKWVGGRDRIEPISVRRELAEATGVRSDRLLEYSDGRRTPESRRETVILESINATETTPDIGAIQAELQRAIERLDVPYNHVAEGTGLAGTDIINLLENDDHSLSTMTRFRTVADRVRDVAGSMLSQAVLENVRMLDTLTRRDLYFDEVETVSEIDRSQRVYDLTVSGTRNYVAGRVPTVMHNTTSSIAVAKEIYGDDWRENFLELNASDQRGIDVVRDRIKSFARASFGGYDHRVIFLDEADALTSDAQSALRRTMEQFSDNTRFILSCNYSSQIIDPIQSRCAVFRFSPLGDEAVEEQIEAIAGAEGIEITDDGMDALVYAAAGDMRKAINGLQAAAVMGGVVDEEAVYTITSTARPEEIEAMVSEALDGDFTAARAQLDTLLTDVGIAGGDIIDQMHRSVWDFDLGEREAVRLMERVGEADYRITAGANEQIQLEALLASLSLDAE